MKILSQSFPLRWLFFTNLTPLRVFVEVIYRIEFLIKLEYISCFTSPIPIPIQAGRQSSFPPPSPSTHQPASMAAYERQRRLPSSHLPSTVVQVGGFRIGHIKPRGGERRWAAECRLKNICCIFKRLTAPDSLPLATPFALLS